MQIFPHLLLLAALLSIASAFREGDFIPAARKSQFHEVRHHPRACA